MTDSRWQEINMGGGGGKVAGKIFSFQHLALDLSQQDLQKN